MWSPAKGFVAFALITLTGAAQVPFQTLSSSQKPNGGFQFKSGPDRFSPKELISLPRPGTGVANPEKEDLLFVQVSQYSFEEKKGNRTIYISPIDSTAGPIQFPILTGGEAFWLDARTLAHVVGEHVYAVSLEYKTQPPSSPLIATPASPYLVGAFPAGASPTNFKFSREAGVLVFSAYVYEDYDLHTVKQQDDVWGSRGTTAKVYDSLFVRHWDEYRGPKRSRLFSVELKKGAEDGKWKLGAEYYKPLKDTEHFAPVEPFGGADDFDISPFHIAYTTKDPSVDEAIHTRQNVYVVPLKGGAKPRHITTGRQGATHNVALSPLGDKVAWTELALDGYESDRAMIVLYDLVKNTRYNLTENWDRSAGELAFSRDGTALFFTAAEKAAEKIFVLSLPSASHKASTALVKEETPIELTSKHSSHGLQPLSTNRLLFSQASLASPNNVFIFSDLHVASTVPHPTHPTISRLLTKPPRVEKLTKFGENELKDRGLDAGEEIWFEGAEKGRQVHGWVLKPVGYEKAKHAEDSDDDVEAEGKKDKDGKGDKHKGDKHKGDKHKGDKGGKGNKGKKWPAVFLIHGGPQGMWEDGWSTRWNPNVFAGQGYFVVAINPTGSTSFGQNFTDAITEDWGGKPFVDLKKGWDHALQHYPIDPERAVAAGASWGGFAINWIQGHPEYGFGFKALVCHDGIFDTRYGGYSTDELFFWNHDFGGKPWEQKARDTAEKFNPSNFVHKWSTPQLTIHGGKDYRLAEPEGLSAFNALQEKGVKSRLVLFPDENHWVLNPDNSYEWHYEVFRWFDQFVGSGAGFVDDA